MTADKTIYAQRKKKANDNTEYCIEPVIEIRTPKTNMPNTIANFSRGMLLENSTDNIVDSNTIHTLTNYTTYTGYSRNWNDCYGIYAPNSDSLFITNNTRPTTGTGTCNTGKKNQWTTTILHYNFIK